MWTPASESARLELSFEWSHLSVSLDSSGFRRFLALVNLAFGSERVKHYSFFIACRALSTCNHAQSRAITRNHAQSRAITHNHAQSRAVTCKEVILLLKWTRYQLGLTVSLGTDPKTLNGPVVMSYSCLDSIQQQESARFLATLAFFKPGLVPIVSHHAVEHLLWAVTCSLCRWEVGVVWSKTNKLKPVLLDLKLESIAQGRVVQRTINPFTPKWSTSIFSFSLSPEIYHTVWRIW